jgi:hypothetical protein
MFIQLLSNLQRPLIIFIQEAFIMSDIKKIPLISSEIAGLWNSYMSDTMMECVLKYYLNRVDDEQTRALMQKTSTLIKQHIGEVTNLFNEIELPIPVGYTDNDVNINAPRLFTDGFYLHYLGFMSRIMMHNYTLILNQIARKDIREFFSKRIIESVDLYNNAEELRLSKGIAIRAPRVEVTKEVQYIKSPSFTLDWFGEKRPLLVLEITYIYAIIFSNIVGRAISTGFGQVSKMKKNSDCFFEGKAVASKQIEELTSLLTDEGVPIPSASDSYVTDSTLAPFSEKLMLNHAMMLSSSRISSLGIAMADTLRSDLQTKYMKYISADLSYSKNGAGILIDNAWLEQSPQAIKHENLVTVLN